MSILFVRTRLLNRTSWSLRSGRSAFNSGKVKRFWDTIILWFHNAGQLIDPRLAAMQVLKIAAHVIKLGVTVATFAVIAERMLNAWRNMDSNAMLTQVRELPFSVPVHNQLLSMLRSPGLSEALSARLHTVPPPEPGALQMAGLRKRDKELGFYRCGASISPARKVPRPRRAPRVGNPKESDGAEDAEDTEDNGEAEEPEGEDGAGGIASGSCYSRDDTGNGPPIPTAEEEAARRDSILQTMAQDDISAFKAREVRFWRSTLNDGWNTTKADREARNLGIQGFKQASFVLDGIVEQIYKNRTQAPKRSHLTKK
ncbi:hypothetical protein MBLNU459_g6498t1 [Dothideomycetes sp. NU459]